MTISRERLTDLLREPQESLELEAKNWLDLVNSADDKATFAKAALAIANHGGGFVILGLTEMNGLLTEAENRPDSLDRYSQDVINGIVQYYCDPPFHCSVHFLPDPNGKIFPIVVVPGGHRVPIRARRSGPNNNTVLNHAIYIRKPGPRSEVPQTSQDWEDLLSRVIRNRKDEFLDHMRDLLVGSVPQARDAPAPDRLTEWIDVSRGRWNNLVAPLPVKSGARMPHGRYSFAYEIIGNRRSIDLSLLPEIIQSSVVRHTGWPPFWFPTRKGIQPYPIDGAVECWLGRDAKTSTINEDAAHSDFWRISPDGLAYLVRGYQEDSIGPERGRAAVPPGEKLDINLPVWRVGETLLQAQQLASRLFEGPSSVRFIATYEGLEGRTLSSVEGKRLVSEGRTSRQSSITLQTHIDTQAIVTNLPEIVLPILKPLYALFDFFDLPPALVHEELARMRLGRF